MSTNYVTEKITAAIRNHLLAVDIIPPTTEANRLASDLTEVVWSELIDIGLSREGVESLVVPASNKTKTQSQS
jgi:hypothetical protein